MTWTKMPDETKETIEKVGEIVRETIEQMQPDWEILQLFVHGRDERKILNRETLAKHYENRMKLKLKHFWRQGRWDGNRPIVIKLLENEE